MGLVQELVRLRKAHGLTQGRLATAAGLTRETVRKVEAGAADTPLSTLLAYAGALGVEFMTVPTVLRGELMAFVQSGGRWLVQPSGDGAPRSIVDEVLGRTGPDEGRPAELWGVDDEPAPPTPASSSAASTSGTRNRRRSPKG